MIWLVGSGLVALALIVAALRGNSTARVALRFAGGLHLDGRRRTDAGAFRRGVKVLHPTGHASKWSHLRHVERAGIRWAFVALCVAVCVGLATAETATVASLIVVASAGVVACVVLGWRKLRELAHVRKYVRPLHKTLAPVIGHPLALRPQSWLTIPRGFAAVEGARLRLALPEGFLATAEAKRIIMTALTDKLALEGGEVEWQTVGKAPAAIVTMSSPPPARVSFGQVREHVESAAESAPVIGLGRNRAVISADFDADSPHVLVSAGSGGGKSTIVRGLLAQGLHNGGLGIVCDIKRISHQWTRGLPNVIYCRSIPEIHNMLLKLKAEVDRRNELVDELADDEGNVPAEALAQIGPRVELVMEEMNATANRLAAHWRKVKEKDDPAVSPAVEALGDILFMGRAVLVNVIAVAQMMTARTLGGPEARENFATRIMARYTLNAWKMLVPEVWPMPRSSRHTGRVQVVIAGIARETQVAYFAPAEAREWAGSGTVARFAVTAAGLALSPVATAGPEPHHVGGRAVSATPGVALVGEPGDARLGLAEACESGVLSIGLAAVRSARARDPEFPPAVGKRGAELVYSADALTRWERNRPASRPDTEEVAE